ncbi:hypothetical protein, partial [Pseudomonas syringae group genomosp. 7]|uniref:hypothetical protein n=1 Tax=Pseudomonas syringae group genomosp. 7 TaxID=251699 RepID=UPI003770535C
QQQLIQGLSRFMAAFDGRCLLVRKLLLITRYLHTALLTQFCERSGMRLFRLFELNGAGQCGGLQYECYKAGHRR